MFPISLLSLATILSPSLALSPLFLCFLFSFFSPFCLLQTKLYLFNAHPNYFPLLPTGSPTISPSLSSAPESCGVSSPFLSSRSSHDFLFPPNDHFFYSPSHSALLPRPLYRDPVPLSYSRLHFLKKKKKRKKKSSLSSWSPLVPSSLPLSLSEWVCGWHSDDRHTARTHCDRRYPQCTTPKGLLIFPPARQPHATWLAFVSGDKVTPMCWLTGEHTDATLTSSSL